MGIAFVFESGNSNRIDSLLTGVRSLRLQLVRETGPNRETLDRISSIENRVRALDDRMAKVAAASKALSEYFSTS
jgi:hypothetical protein